MQSGKLMGARAVHAKIPRQSKSRLLTFINCPREPFSRVCLLQAYDHVDDHDINIEYCQGEFLSQGALDLPSGCAITVILEQLNALGLDRIYSPPNRHQLWRAVDPMRKRYTNESKKADTTTEWDPVRAIAQCICSRRKFRTVVTLLLLSIKPRYRLDPKILKGLAFSTCGRLELS